MGPAIPESGTGRGGGAPTGAGRERRDRGVAAQHGRLHPRPVDMRIGTPVTVDPAGARAKVVRPAAPPASADPTAGDGAERRALSRAGRGCRRIIAALRFMIAENGSVSCS